MGVKNLDVFNLSLLGKWRWRLLVDKDACWHKIIASRYGEPSPKSNALIWNPKNSSTWWGDLNAIESNRGDLSNWFSKDVRRRIGNGESILFWHDV